MLRCLFAPEHPTKPRRKSRLGCQPVGTAHGRGDGSLRAQQAREIGRERAQTEQPAAIALAPGRDIARVQASEWSGRAPARALAHFGENIGKVAKAVRQLLVEPAPGAFAGEWSERRRQARRRRSAPPRGWASGRRAGAPGSRQRSPPRRVRRRRAGAAEPAGRPADSLALVCRAVSRAAASIAGGWPCGARVCSESSSIR